MKKKSMANMSDFSDFNSTAYNSRAANELADLSTIIRDAGKSVLSDINPDVAKDYASIKSAYAETMQGILPTNIEGLVKNGKKGMYEQLGRLISSSGSESQLRSMMNSIRTAHKELVKSGKKPEPLDDLLDAMKSGFLTQYMPKLVSGGFEVIEISNVSPAVCKAKRSGKAKYYSRERCAKG